MSCCWTARPAPNCSGAAWIPALPLWSARALLEAPDVLRAIHADYTRRRRGHHHDEHLSHASPHVGARRHGRTRARELTQLAVQIAREAARQADREIFVAGSMSPLEDCYSPQLVPPDGELWIEHAEMARDLAQAGCDLLLVETMNTIREAVIAARCAAATGLPVCVSFVAGLNGLPPDQVDEGAADETLARMTLLSGESIARGRAGGAASDSRP